MQFEPAPSWRWSRSTQTIKGEHLALGAALLETRPSRAIRGQLVREDVHHAVPARVSSGHVAGVERGGGHVLRRVPAIERGLEQPARQPADGILAGVEEGPLVEGVVQLRPGFGAPALPHLGDDLLLARSRAAAGIVVGHVGADVGHHLPFPEVGQGREELLAVGEGAEVIEMPEHDILVFADGTGGRARRIRVRDRCVPFPGRGIPHVDGRVLVLVIHALLPPLGVLSDLRRVRRLRWVGPAPGPWGRQARFPARR